MDLPTHIFPFWSIFQLIFGSPLIALKALLRDALINFRLKIQDLLVGHFRERILKEGTFIRADLFGQRLPSPLFAKNFVNSLFEALH